MCFHTHTVISLPWWARPDMATAERTGGRTPPGSQCSTPCSTGAGGERGGPLVGANAGGPRNSLIQRRIASDAVRNLSGGLCRSLQCRSATLGGYRGVSDPLFPDDGPLRGPSKGVAHAPLSDPLRPARSGPASDWRIVRRRCPFHVPAHAGPIASTRGAHPQSVVVGRNMPWR